MTTLNAATTYTFEVQAFNSAIASSGVYQSAMTLPTATTVTATGVSASEIDLKWNPVPGATSYTVEQGTTKIATLTGNSSTSYKDTGLAAGTTYSFTVIASDASGGTLSAPVSTITYPALPTVNITGDYSTEIDLNWNSVQGATGYTIYEMLSLSSYKVFTQTGNSNTTFKATGLTPDTTYYFMVGASDASGTNLSLNNVVQATTLSGPPATLGVFTWQLSVTAGQSMAVTVTAFDQYGKYSDSNINVELTASTGQSWTVPIDGGSGDVYVNFAHAGTVSLQATYGSITSASATVTVDAPTMSLNSIWTGYAATPGSGVTAVGGSWIQPSVYGPNGSENSIWVGIDGFGGSTVEQCGVATTMVNGTPQSVAWYEFYGDQTPSSQNPNPNPKGSDYYQQNISQSTFPVRPGDIISASVSLVPGTTREFLFQMTDQPVDGAKTEVFSTLQTMQYVTPARSTVEWIVENPNNGARQLAGFSSMRITGAWATVDSTTSDINQLSNLVNIPMGSGTTAFTSVSNPPEVDYGVGYTEPASGTWRLQLLCLLQHVRSQQCRGREWSNIRDRIEPHRNAGGRDL